MTHSGNMQPLTISSAKNLAGTAPIPGDKSISHRSLILGAMCVGETQIQGLLEGEDVIATADAMRAFGAKIERDEKGIWHVHGLGTAGFLEPENVIDCGNSGTGVRLIMGAVAPCGFNTIFTGDASLRSRPMDRVTIPLALCGAEFHGRSKGRLPLLMKGAANPLPLEYTTPMPSAQVKSAVLLAGLGAKGETIVTEREATRDHTERMLQGFGANIETTQTNEGYVIRLEGLPELQAQRIQVPSDPSSAAFPVCAALITEGSEVRIPNIGMNPTRNGLYLTLQEMGANLTFENERIEGGEAMADIVARFSPNMKGITVPEHRAASMIDEYPVLSVVASFAEGETIMRGVKELRVKECDRISVMVTGLRDCGVKVDEEPEGFIVHGAGMGGVKGGASIKTHLDHRIAMSFFVLALGAQNAVTIDDERPIRTSFPNFIPLMQELGVNC